MRTTLQIIIAVKECEPVTEEELKLALIALSNIEHFYNKAAQDLIDAIRAEKSMALLKMKAEFAWGTIESMFKAKKTPPDTWLGPDNTPGTPENKRQMEMGKKIFKAATGMDL